MGPVPQDLDLSACIGRQLNQICVGPFDVQFHFDCDLSIACQGSVIAEHDGKITAIFDGQWLDASPLPRLVGRDAIGWKIEASHEFSILLSDGVKLRFVSKDHPYEDFVIHPDTVVV
jgi:hypothetical protein